MVYARSAHLLVFLSKFQLGRLLARMAVVRHHDDHELRRECAIEFAMRALDYQDEEGRLSKKVGLFISGCARMIKPVKKQIWPRCPARVNG